MGLDGLDGWDGIGLDWIRLNWIGLDWMGLGLCWFGLGGMGLDWLGWVDGVGSGWIGWIGLDGWDGVGIGWIGSDWMDGLHGFGIPSCRRLLTEHNFPHSYNLGLGAKPKVVGVRGVVFRQETTTAIRNGEMGPL